MQARLTVCHICTASTPSSGDHGYGQHHSICQSMPPPSVPDGLVVRMLDLRLRGHRFDSRPTQNSRQVTSMRTHTHAHASGAKQ